MNDNNLLEKSYKDLPVLTKHAGLLLELALEMKEAKFLFKESDDFGFMCISFFFKQVDHYQSVLKLVQFNQGSDATIIARVMLEGLHYLLWASSMPGKRARDWRSYALVSDYKLLLKNQTMEKFELYEATIRSRIKEECSQFLTSAGKKSIEAESMLDESSFRAKWLVDDNGKTIPIEGIFTELESKDLLELYSEMCDWVHWNPRGIGTKIERKESYILFLENPPNDAATALAAGFQSLYQLMEMVNQHFSLEFLPLLEKAREEYIKEIADNHT